MILNIMGLMNLNGIIEIGPGHDSVMQLIATKLLHSVGHRVILVTNLSRDFGKHRMV